MGYLFDVAATIHVLTAQVLILWLRQPNRFEYHAGSRISMAASTTRPGCR
jgi:hypothetical protein